MRSITALILSAAAFLAGSIMYSKKIYCRQDFSYGLPLGTRIYFLFRRHRFRRPRGIARFPDGGQVRTVSDEVALFSYARESDTLTRLGVLSARPEPGTNIRNAKLKMDRGVLYIAYKCNNRVRKPDAMQCRLLFDLETGDLRKLEDPAEVLRVRELFADYWPLHRDQLTPISTLKKIVLSRLEAADRDRSGAE